MSSNQNKIAVIGMACRFPGAKNISEYWDNLVNGKDTIKQFTDDEISGYEINFEDLKKDPNYVKARGIIENIDMFDAKFFEQTPQDAKITDPQHRIWLETTWDAFENAACDPYTFDGSIGVFAGGYINTYLLNNVLRDPRKFENYIRLRSTESFQIMTANDITNLPTKTAYKFNLRGPAINVQTACSTSLVAISQACQSLFNFESDICVAGGVCLLTPQETGYIYQEGAIPSPDGHCRPFDAKAQGTVFSNGVGIVVLKRLEDAIADKDNIVAVVDGWALNNDGNKKVSYTAPSVEGQANVILMAQTFSEISADDIGYIEAHGTATPLGDPIEIAALSKAFSQSTDKKQFCGIGSVKSNIGHTDAAAGAAAFIKCCLSVYNRVIPPSLHFNSPNPHINFENSPFYVVDKLQKWESDKKLIVGVSSFGIGGTNAHVILEEPPRIVDETTLRSNSYILPISAKSSSALKAREKELVEFIKENPKTDINDLVYTLWQGRNHMKHRAISVVHSIDDILNENLNFEPRILDENLNSISFLFPGQGAQYYQMGIELYNSNNSFKKDLDRGFELYFEETGINLKDIIFNWDSAEDAEKKLAETSITQPALFIIEYCLAKSLLEFEIIPKYLIGHSIGEYAAACISGIFDFTTALKIVIKRGSLMQSMPAGKMYAVRSSRDKLLEIGNSLYEVAAENAPNSCTISFEFSNTEKIKQIFAVHEIQYLPLNTSHAFHSKAFDPILHEFSEYVNQFKLNPPKYPVISGFTGGILTPEQATSGEYWSQQLRNTILFHKGILTVLSNENACFIEVGPNRHLSSILRSIPEVENKKAIIQTIGNPGNYQNHDVIERVMGNIWSCFENRIPNLDFIDKNAKKIILPTYPFERQSYWIDFIPSSDGFAYDLTREDKTSTTSIAEISSSSSTDTIILELRKILTELTGYNDSEIKEDVTFDNLGLDSLLLTQFSRKIELKFKLKIEFRKLNLEYPTLEVLSEFIRENSQVIAKKELGDKQDIQKPEIQLINNFAAIQPAGELHPLVIVHGENANNFLPSFLGNNRPYYGYYHLGSDGEEIPFNNIHEMSKAYLDQLLKQKPEGPYIIGGFSLGGVLAFEMATMLQKLGHEVPLLLIFDAKNGNMKEPFKWHKTLYRVVRSNISSPIYHFFMNNLKRAICECFIFAKKPIPIKLRNKYILLKYKEISNDFNPVKYNGNVILFRADLNNSVHENLGWDNLVNNLESISLRGKHGKLFENKENIEIIKKVIKERIDIIQ